MCARYELTTPPERMIERFGLILPEGHELRKPRAFERGEVRPTNLAPVVTAHGAIALLPWGLSVPWQLQPLINARGETLESKPTFKPLLQYRCLVPASAYFEWRKEGKLKIKTRIHPANDNLFAMAGLIGDGRFTIVTCAPAPSIAHIHDRMPVIISRRHETAWLDTKASITDLHQFLDSPPHDFTVLEATVSANPQMELFG
ncbi:MAG: SOS response-associated peptidase [Alphaproteobacteria bacterium]|nr:SOS response-associated peptidase [Alphaproteobacteria bacterium]